jgi:hypothetical protein
MNDQSQITAHVSDALDIGFSAGAITLPLWLQYVMEAGQIIAVVGGITLLAIRIALALREWKRGGK